MKIKHNRMRWSHGFVAFDAYCIVSWENRCHSGWSNSALGRLEVSTRKRSWDLHRNSVIKSPTFKRLRCSQRGGWRMGGETPTQRSSPDLFHRPLGDFLPNSLFPFVPSNGTGTSVSFSALLLSNVGQNQWTNEFVWGWESAQH